MAGGGYLLWRFRAAIWLAWLQFWQDLRGIFLRPSPKTDRVAEVTPAASWPTFASFRNPFLRGETTGDDELIRYTFMALEAWAREHGCPRASQTTPLEFARQLAAAFPSLAPSIAYVMASYDRLAYAGSVGGPVEQGRVRVLWEKLQAESPAEKR